MSKAASEKLDSALLTKVRACIGILKELSSVVVGFSGGVDSSLLTALAAEALGHDSVLAVIGVSPLYPRRETEAARRTAEQLGVELVEIETSEMDDPTFIANPPERCYHCKRELFSRLKEIAAERQIKAILSGTNADDAGDFRPGLRAEEQLGVRRPLLEAGLSKQDIRTVSRAMGLETAEKPSLACMASRIPYNKPITREKLRRIEYGERVLRDLGFRQCRLRDHDTIARIEVTGDEIIRAAEMRDRIVEEFKKLGYTYITLDLQGFRSGAMNEVL